MINFDFITLDLFLRENIDFLSGARLQKIQQPTRQELIFSMRNKIDTEAQSKHSSLCAGGLVNPPYSANQSPALIAPRGESRKFYINISPRFFHLCFMSSENEKKRHIEIPKQPPMFCMLLRKYLEGAKIAKIIQPKDERILEFYFETYNELSEKIYLCLAIELMGKHSNVILYNYDTNVIIGCMHNVGAEKSEVREIIGGLPYAYPPKINHKNFSGFSQLLKETIEKKPQESSQTRGFNPLSKKTINETIDNYFADLQEQENIKSLKSRLLTVTKTKLRKVDSASQKVKKQSTSVEKADLYRKKGDLIMANLYSNKDFSKSIEILDYETNSTLKIDLDETKTLKENANQFYKLYNKAKTANLKATEMAENLKQEREYLEQVLYSIEAAQSVEDLMEINQEGKKERRKEGKPSFSPSLPPALNLLTIHHSPFTIYVGKNNKQNDFIVSKLARSEDLWFHTHNCAGSHVLLRVEAGQNVTDEVIFECAKLAKEYSSAKNSSKVGIIYTQAKNLKKPPAAPLGYVTYKNEKEIIVD